jgi:hypothetical protein
VIAGWGLVVLVFATLTVIVGVAGAVSKGDVVTA